MVHIRDLAELDHPVARIAVESDGIGTILWVALRHGDRLLGLISAARTEVRPFSEHEIALLQSFGRSGRDCDGERATAR